MPWPLPLISTLQKIGTAGGDLTGAEPAGAQSGDLLVASVVYRGGVTFTPPSGWTQRANNPRTGTSTRTGGAATDALGSQDVFVGRIRNEGTLTRLWLVFDPIALDAAQMAASVENWIDKPLTSMLT